MSFKGRPDLDLLLPEDNFLFSGFISTIGGGLAIDIPLSKRVSLFLNSNFAGHTQNYSLGIIVGNWKVAGSKEPRESKKK